MKSTSQKTADGTSDNKIPDSGQVDSFSEAVPLIYNLHGSHMHGRLLVFYSFGSIATLFVILNCLKLMSILNEGLNACKFLNFLK
jgi:hypothetical protein